MASQSVLEAHGILSSELDPVFVQESVGSDHGADHVVSGKATFSPREGYPTLHGFVKMGERVPVTFWLVPASAITAQARRERHYLSLLAAASPPPRTTSRLASPRSKGSTLSPNTPISSEASSSEQAPHSLLPLPSINPPSPVGSPALTPKCPSTCDCTRAPVQLASRIIALWEDVHGLWTVFAEDGEVDELVSLEEWWREVVEGKLHGENVFEELERQKEHQQKEKKEEGKVCGEDGQHWAGEDKPAKVDRNPLHIYADATDILISLAETLLSLHQRRLLLSTVRPDFFACRKPRQSIPITSLSGPLSDSIEDPSTLGHPPTIPLYAQPHCTLELRRFSSVVPLPGFDRARPTSSRLHHAASSSHSHQSHSDPSIPRVRPSLFVSSSQDGEDGPSEDSSWAGEDEEAFIKANLRWLAPEIFSSKRSTSLSERADVYSFGVLMWELMTGKALEPQVSDLLADIHNHLTAPVPNPADVLSSGRSAPPFLPSSDPMPELSQSLQSSSLDAPSLPSSSSSTFSSSPSSRPPIPTALAEICLRCLQKDLDDRYISISTLLHDLRTFQSLARLPSAPSDGLNSFEVGAVDRASRFQLSPELVDRTSQTEELDRAFHQVTGGSEGRGREILKPKVLEVWGASGSGKTGVVTRWAKGLEKEQGGQKCLVGWAKLDQHLTKPLSAFVQIFTSLLDRIFSSPQEPHDAYREKILSAVSGQGAVFFSLISKEWRSVLLPNERAEPVMNELDWENFVAAFRGWAKRLLQIFASADRPLVIVLDDVQWLGDEAQLWIDILEGRIQHVLVVSIYRTDAPDVPPPTHLVSSVQQIQVPPLTHAGVAAFLGASFGWTDEQLKTKYLPLVRFCRSKTGGNPFHLQSLVSSLYYEGSFNFDFESLSWTFNLIEAEANASDAMEGVDELLARSLGSLPIQVKLCIQTLACLPSSGFDLDPLSQLLDLPRSRLDSYLGSPNLAGVIIVSESSVRFSHDRMQAAAYKLISAVEKPLVHFKIASWLQRSTFSDAFVYDAVDNMILARDLGYPLDSQDQLDDLAEFACRAAQRAASSASFAQALSYLRKADSIVDFSLGSTWTRLRDLSFQYAKTSSEIFGALRLYEEAVGRLQGFLAFASTQLEKLELLTLLARIHIASGSFKEAMETCESATRSCGFEPHVAPKGPNVHVPSRPEDCDYEKILPAVQAYRTTELSMEEKEMLSLTMLIAYVGATFFVKREDHGKDIFALAISICYQSRVVRPDILSYLLGAWSLSVARAVSLEFNQAVIGLTERLIEMAPASYLAPSTFICILTQRHRTKALDQIDFESAYESAMHTSNYDAGGYIVAIAFATWLYSSVNFYAKLPLIRSWFEQTMNMTQASRVFCGLPLQVSESFASSDLPLDQLWRLVGPFVEENDYDVLSDLPFHSFAFMCFSVKLAIFMRTAPIHELKKLVASAEVKRAGASGTIWWCEWSFLHSVYLILHEPDTEENRAQVERNIDDLRASSCSVDFAIRIRIVNAFQAMASAHHWTEAMSTIEDTIQVCCDHGFIILAGFLSSYAATWIVDKAGRTGPAALGLALSARDHYLRSGAIALARQVESAHSSLADYQIVSSRYPSYPLPSSVLKPSGELVRADKSDGSSTKATSVSFRSDTPISSTHQDSKLASTLDHLTFVRASLVIASEKNPKKAVTHLLRLLLQLCRMDFAAIALLDSSGSGLRLRGAGSFQALEACDLSPVDATHLAPVSILLHVARTQKAITSVSQLETIRDDPFWTSKRPKSALVLPLTLQGTFLGVLLLSSNSTLPSATNVEIVTALASFAAITLESRTQRANLEDLVQTRTQALEAALDAKSAFLNHMSHELRSPLFAILGLAAVLESSTDDMSPASKEHISQIILSGNDLQRVIGNVLDVSKLSSGFVKVESLSFTLREVCEAAMSTVQIAAQTKNIEIVLTSPLEFDPPPLLGDSFRVQQCLLNLLSNAAKFSKEGAILISYTCEPSASRDRLITISVKDNGPGIPEDALQNRLFKPFSQVDASITRSHGGSGLGLLIVKELAVMMGGDAWATSKVGEGSTFSFSVLVKEDSSLPVPEPISFPEQKALILCDDSFSRRNLIVNLRYLNVRLVTTFNALDEALSPEFEHSLISTQYDILLLNPDYVPNDKVKHISKIQPSARIFYLVKAKDLGAKVSQMNLPASAFLPRPIKRSNLYDIVRPRPKGQSNGKKKDMVKTVSSQGIDSTLGSTAPLRILIVDDNKVNTVVGGKILERFGYKSIDICHDGLQACNRTLEEAYDLIFMDLSMPVMDGLEANRIISSRETPTKKPLIVALTANTDRDTQDLTVTEGFFDYLQKPLHIPSMARVLRESYKVTKKASAPPPPSSS